MRIVSLLLLAMLVALPTAYAEDDDKTAPGSTAKTVKEQANDARETARDAKDEARDTARDAKDSARDASKEADREARESTDDEARSTSRDRESSTRSRSGSDDSEKEYSRDSSKRDRDDDSQAYDRDREDRDNRSGDQNRSDYRSKADREDRSYSKDDRSRDSNRGRRELGATYSNDDDDRLVISSFGRESVLSSTDLRRGDAIISVNGRRVSNDRDFERWIYEGERPAVVVWRDGRERTIYLENMGGGERYTNQQATATLGVVLDTRYRDEAVIRSVNHNGAADDAGLERGDTILSIDGQQVSNLSELRQALSQYSPGDEVEVEFARDDREDMTVATLEAAAPQRASRAYPTEDRSYARRTYDDDGVRRSSYREGELYIDEDVDVVRRGAVDRDRNRTFAEGDVRIEDGRRDGTRGRNDGDYRNDNYRNDGRGTDGRGVLGRRGR